MPGQPADSIGIPPVLIAFLDLHSSPQLFSLWVFVCLAAQSTPLSELRKESDNGNKQR